MYLGTSKQIRQRMQERRTVGQKTTIEIHKTNKLTNLSAGGGEGKLSDSINLSRQNSNAVCRDQMAEEREGRLTKLTFVWVYGKAVLLQTFKYLLNMLQMGAKISASN